MNEIYLTFTAGSVCLFGVCSHPWSVCEIVLVPCAVCAVVALTVNACEVSVLRGCKGDGNAGVEDGGSVIAVSVGCEYMGGTHGSGTVSSADDVLEVSVVHRV